MSESVRIVQQHCILFIFAEIHGCYLGAALHDRCCQASAGASKGCKNKLLTLMNEVKIITSFDDAFKLWQQVISCAARGDLIDVDSKELTKFKDHKNFEPEKDGVLTREFFKFLGNLSKADHAKLCRHILNRSGPSRKLPHLKVVVKQPMIVIEDYYSVKEWIERWKKKATARF